MSTLAMWWRNWSVCIISIALLIVTHVLNNPSTEPFRNNDETRHVMTGVFFRDALTDLPESLRNPKHYAIRYYGQYPALGILVWPPMFHFAEGLAMLVFGTEYTTARGLIAAFAILAGVSLYRLVRKTHDDNVAAMSLALFGVSPLVFDFSRMVLVEMPALALLLTAILHFERYLSIPSWRDALLATLLAAAAALTRFEAILILPYFAIRLVTLMQIKRLLDRPVVIGMGLALLATVPYYALTYLEYRPGLEAAAIEGTGSDSTGFLKLQSLWLYLQFIPRQMSMPAIILSAVGVLLCLRSWRGGPYVALFLATGITVVPLAEPESRHAIYWVPSLVVLAAICINQLGAILGPWASIGLAIFVITVTGYEPTHELGYYLCGYEKAARLVVERAQDRERPIFVDGMLTAGMIYQIRQADPARKHWVLRADKVLYAMLSDPSKGYREFTKNDTELLQLLHDYDPEFLILEHPHPFVPVPAAARLRKVLVDHPERFERIATIAFDTNHDEYAACKLEVYRKLDRNPTPKRAVDIPVLGLGRSLSSER